MSPSSVTGLDEVVATLARHHGRVEPPPTRDPFELVLFENVAYLASPRRRLVAFQQLRETVGTTPEALLAASREQLEAAGAQGILKGTSADKPTACARIARERFGGDLAGALRREPARARRALRAFPGIGEPGAEKILLFSGLATGLAPESNALRVLVRLGLVEEQGSYARTYAAARPVGDALPRDTRRVQQAHLLLRHHGQTLCRNNRPRCPDCPLQDRCAHARAEAEKAAQG